MDNQGGTYGFKAELDDNAKSAISSNQRTSGIQYALGKVDATYNSLGANNGKSGSTDGE